MFMNLLRAFVLAEIANASHQMLQGYLPNLLIVKPFTFPDICVELYFVHDPILIAHTVQILDDLWAGRMESSPFRIWAEREGVEDCGAVQRRAQFNDKY
jgi:hypothetical protein